MTEFSIMADTKINGEWANQSLSLFAVVPDLCEQDFLATSVLVDELVRSYRDAPDNRDGSETRNEVLAELYDLHARGQVLWPLGVPWGQSALGEVLGFRFSYLIEEEDPFAFEHRELIEHSDALVNAGYAKERGKHISFEFWRVFMTLRLATIGLDSIIQLSEEHLASMLNAMTVDGLWANWALRTVKAQMLRFARLVSSHQNNPLFAAGFLNPRRRTRASSRLLGPTQDDHLDWFDEAFEIWLDRQVALTKKSIRLAKRLFYDFLLTRPAEERAPDKAFSRSTVKGLLSFASAWSTLLNRSLAMPKFFDFAEWYCHEHARHKGIVVELGLIRYDVEQFMKSLPSLPARGLEVRARPMPMRFQVMLKRIILEDDFAWPKSLLHGTTGMPVHWLPTTDPETGQVRSVFCEVLPRMLLLHLELPLRNIQVRRLDSGEGDDREYDPASKTWRNAHGASAGHWRRSGAKNVRRGVFREIHTETGTIAGFWINSNKTKDSKNLFDEDSCYEIPWQHDEVLENLWAMRKWQEAYNPVVEPLPHAKLPEGLFKEEPSRAVRAVLPARFYLFRYPQNVGHRGREAPPSYPIFLQFFLDALDELERRLRDEDPDSAIQIITERDVSRQPRKAIFTLHGLRSSTLTNLHSSGVPIGVLSKVVAGHATILMTLRYTKFNPAHVNEILNDARSKAMLDSRGQFSNFLKNATTEQAMRMTARLADDGLQHIKGSYEEPTFWSRMDIGICPNGCTQCHIGGDAIQKRKEKDGRERTAYRPVPGGQRNCVRCRFFVTGVPFLLPLCAHATAILAKVDSLSRRMDSVNAEAERLKSERRTLGAAAPQALINRIRILDETFVAESELRDQVLADAHATMVLVEKIRAIANSGDVFDEVKLPMLLGHDGTPDVAFRDSTRFEIVDAVVQASRWFPSINSTELEAERDEFLNQVLYRNGYVPFTYSPLTLSERRKAADALAELLLVELGATEVQHVIEGRKTLADLGLQDKLERAATAATGRPIERLALPARTLAVTIEGAPG